MIYYWSQKMSGEIISESWYIDCGEYVFRWEYDYLRKGVEWVKLIKPKDFADILRTYQPKLKKVRRIQQSDLTKLMKAVFNKKY
jgi:hypothetical protein